jgi:adhesin HecA-like repeat protein
VLGREDLTEPERAVWDAIETGSLVQLPLGAPAADDPAAGESWGQARQVRAQLLYELLAGINGPKDVRPRALRLSGARITGTLDLEAISLVCPLLLRRCSFEQPINLQEAQAPAVRLPGCRVPSLNAEQFQTRGNLELDDGFAADGEVRLLGAHIGGGLSFEGATLTNDAGPALYADGLTVDQDMFCRKPFSAIGEIRLLGAHISGQLGLEGATLTNDAGPALNADGLTVDQDMFCREGFKAEGGVSLLRAHINGVLSFEGGTLTYPGQLALDLEGARVRGLFLRPKARPDG